jgi:hypothetical protein
VPATQPRSRRVEREARADHDFVARCDCGHELDAARIDFLGDCDSGGNDDRARMQLRIVVIVELERVRCGRIDQCRIGSSQ